MFKRGILPFVGGIVLAVPAIAEETRPAPSADQESTAAAAPRTDRERRAAEILRQMLPLEIADSMASKKPTSRFGGEMSRLAVENAYEQLWTRPGLSLKDRSMITISMLIASGNDRELKVHVESGLRNGVTPAELEEIIYHATAYVGFPRASGALAIATEVIAREGKVR